MKANDQARPTVPLLALAAASAALLLVSGCAQRAPLPAPAPAPAARPTPAPQPLPPAPRPALNWRDAPITPGTWRWGMAGGNSTASFGQPGSTPLLTLICDRNASAVRLVHAGPGGAQVPLGITTTSGGFPLMSDPASGASGMVTAIIPARAKVLDAMAYSRGRFAVEVPGLAPSYIPAWPEVSRVVEDCR